MNLDIDKDWFAKKAAQEGDLEIGAGMRKTLTVDLTPEEIALLERLIDPAKSDMRARIAALEAENQDLRSGSYLVGVIEERERLRRAGIAMQIAVAKVLECGGTSPDGWFDALAEAQRNLSGATKASRDEFDEARAALEPKP